MREILFKAKRIDNGEWVVGQYVNTCYPGMIRRQGTSLSCIQMNTMKFTHPLSASSQDFVTRTVRESGKMTS